MCNVKHRFITRHKIPVLSGLLLMAFCAIAQDVDADSILYEETFSASSAESTDAWRERWEAVEYGPVESSIKWVAPDEGTDGALAISTSHNDEGGVWLAVQTTEMIAVEPGQLFEVSYEAELTNSRNCFVSVNFEPLGGETRIYFAEGGAERRVYRRSIEAPPGTDYLRLVLASDGPTEQMLVDWVRVRALNRPKVVANWEPRPTQTAFPKSEKPPKAVLQVLDARGMDWESSFLANIIQGRINRDEPEVYLINYDEDQFWLDWLIERGYVRETQELDDLQALIDFCRDRVEKTVIYDRAVPGSIHAAAMIASVRGELACSAEMADRFDLEVTEDLRGRWSRNIDAYRHVYENYWDRMNHHILAVHYPSMENSAPRDYIYANKVFTFFVSDYRDATPAKDEVAEWEFLREIMAATPPNIPVLGWFSYREHAGLMEFNALRLCSSYGKYLSVSEFSSNTTVHSGIEVNPTVFRQAKMRAKPPVEVESDKLYLSLSVIDSGDCHWYWQRHQLGIWRDENRGAVPMGWSLNPTLVDVMPAVLEWYYRNATENDAFFCAMSGMGYFLSYQWGSRLTDADRERAWKVHLEDLQRYCEMLDLDMLTMHTGGWTERSGAHRDVYKRYLKGVPALTGLLPDFGRHENTRPDEARMEVSGRPVFHTLMRWITWDHLSNPMDTKANEQTDPNVDFTVGEAVRWAPTARPGLMSGLVLSWTMHPTRVMQVAERLPEDFVVVLPTELPYIYEQIKALGTADPPTAD